MDLAQEIEKILFSSIRDDLGEAGDVTSNAIISRDIMGNYIFRAREEMVFCGVEILKKGFGDYINVHVEDGQKLAANTIIAETTCRVIETLALERSVLNMLIITCSIATETNRYVKAIEGTRAKILDTRKTIPGMRAISKYAVKCGGGQNHRMGLYDMVMIKDNHIKATGGITAAIGKAKSTGLKIEVECDTFAQVKEALSAGADIIMADNMTPAQLKKVVALVNGKVPVEASGGVNLKTVRKIAETGVDFISTSKITMGAMSVDIGLDEV